MNVNDATKTDIHAEINRLRAILGTQPLAAYKAKDLTKDQLVELLDLVETDLTDATEAIAEAIGVDTTDDNYGAYIEANEPSIGRSGAPKPKRAPMYNDNGDRKCGCCGQYFPTTDFGTYAKSKDGFASYTLAHTNAYRAAKRAATKA